MIEIDKLTSQTQATNTAWERFQENKKKEWGLAGHDCGIHALNLMIGGWLPGKVTTIGARSGIGKTALVTQMFDAGRRVLNGRRAEFLFFSWEMAPSYIVDRHVCNKVGLSNRMLVQGAKLLDKIRLEKVANAYTDARNLPVVYQEASLNIAHVSNLVTKFAERCRKQSKVEGVYVHPVIVIDYIGIAKFEGAGIRTYGIAEFMSSCKQIANAENCSFCIMAQISRGADEKAMPTRGDFADSQSIEQASDNLILLHRPEYNDTPMVRDPEKGGYVQSAGKIVFKVLKSRDFGLDEKLLDCRMAHFRFKSQEHMYTTKYWELYESEDFWKKHFKIDKMADARQKEEEAEKAEKEIPF